DCQFDECDDYGLAAVIGANAEVRRSKFNSCQTGIKCGIAKEDIETQSGTSEASSSLIIDQCSFVSCVQAAANVSAGGNLTLQNQCTIDGGRYALLVDAGVISTNDIKIENTQSEALIAIAEAKVELVQTTI